MTNQSGQDDSGLRRLLTFSRFYEVFQGWLLGGQSARRWLAGHFWKLSGGEVVVDLGCGTGSALEFLPPDISYWGVDISEGYIRAARKNFSNRAQFFLGTVHEFLESDSAHPGSVDLVLCNGLLHHLNDDDAIEVLELSKRLLKPSGRLACLEAVILARQSKLSRWIVNSDRGRYVRTESEWKQLVGRVYNHYRTQILTGLIRMPYTHIIIECANQPAFLKT